MRSRSSFVALVLTGGLAVSACANGRGPSSVPTSISAATTSTTMEMTTATPSSTAGRPPLPFGASWLAEPVTASAAAGDITSGAAILAAPQSSAAALDSAAITVVSAYRAVAAHPDWTESVIAQVPPQYRSGARANITAATELRALTAPKANLPPWRIVVPPPAAELLADYKAAESATGIPWTYLAAVHLVETRMGRIRGPSTAGARGPMQFLPSTWARYGNGGDIENAHDAIAAAARLLAADGGPSDMGKALFAYNHSPHYVRAVTLYAQQMQADERAYVGYHAWPVVYRMVAGDVLLDMSYVGAP